MNLILFISSNHLGLRNLAIPNAQTCSSHFRLSWCVVSALPTEGHPRNSLQTIKMNTKMVQIVSIIAAPETNTYILISVDWIMKSAFATFQHLIQCYASQASSHISPLGSCGLNARFTSSLEQPSITTNPSNTR